MRDGVRIVNCARGELVDLDALLAGLESGKRRRRALDVFPEEPFTEHPLFERDDVVVTPHLGASTAEAQDRAGIVTAEQVLAALTGGVVTNAVNIAAVRPEAMEALAPFVPLCEKLGRLAAGARRRRRSTGSQVEFHGRIAEHDTRLLGIAVLVGILSGHTEEPVNLVNAPAMAEERGIDLVEIKEPARRRLHRAGQGPRSASVEVAGTGVGPRNVPYLVGRLGPELLHALRRPPGDLPLRRSAGDDRPRRHGLRRARRQHRLRRRRRRGQRRRGGDGADHRRARPRRRDRRDRSGDGFFAGRAVDL